jgi:hypothetical protein
VDKYRTDEQKERIFMELDLLVNVCFIAFLAVFALLLLLAGIMRVIELLFPGPVDEVDCAVYAAINTVYYGNYPSMKITRIEELT